MEAHSGGGMKSGQHEPIGGGEAVDRFLNINFSLLNREKRVRSWLDSYLKSVSELTWRASTAWSLTLSVTIWRLRAI